MVTIKRKNLKIIGISHDASGESNYESKPSHEPTKMPHKKFHQNRSNHLVGVQLQTT